jgi:hypothetical protein
MKILKLAVIAALLLPAARALALMDLSAFGGYTTLGMGDVNSGLNSAAAGNANVAVTTVNSGFYVGGDAGFTVFPFLKVGPRLEYVQAGQGSLSSGGTKVTYDANLMQYELGLSVDSSLPLTGLSVIGGVWGGYGVASTQAAFSQYSDVNSGLGGGFVGEAAAQLRYKLFAGLSLGLDLGYRLANISNVNSTKTFYDSSFWNSLSGQPYIKNSNGSQGSIDFSGMNIGGALSFDF